MKSEFNSFRKWGGRILFLSLLFFVSFTQTSFSQDLLNITFNDCLVDLNNNQHQLDFTVSLGADAIDLMEACEGTSVMTTQIFTCNSSLLFNLTTTNQIFTQSGLQTNFGGVHLVGTLICAGNVIETYDEWFYASPCLDDLCIELPLSISVQNCNADIALSLPSCAFPNPEVSNFTWDFGDGTIITGSGTIPLGSNTTGAFDHPVHQYMQNGTYDVELTAEITNPVGDREVSADSEVSVSPNPSVGNFLIDAEGFGTNRVEIFNALGALVYSENRNFGDRFDLSLNNLPSGIYRIVLYNDGGERNMTTVSITQ